MKKLLFLLLPYILFAFSSKFFPEIDISVKCDRILHKTAFDICYSCKNKTPNVVLYKLEGELVKQKLKRNGLKFRPDYQLPTRCRSYSKDYSHTGFDRGHLAPNAAFDYNRKIQKETFLMSNIAPQKPKLNRRLWAKIERFTRLQARKYGTIKVATGVCESLGKIKRNVNIPKWWYKIIYIPETDKWIAFLVPNTNKGMSKAKTKNFLVPIETIEQECGIKIVTRNQTLFQK